MIVYFVKSNLKVLYTLLTLLICDGDFVQACVLT